MRLKISSIVICLILAVAFVVVAKMDISKADSKNETISKSEESSTVTTYKPLKSVVEPSPFMLSGVYETNPEKDVEEKEETTTEIATKEIETYSEPTDDIESIEEETSTLVFSEREIDLLLRIGMCEAGGESVECVAHVMRTVLNRVEDDYFPNSIYDVLYQKGQFTPVSSGWINTVQPSEKCHEALEMIKSGWDETQGALYFESCSGSSWHSRNLEYLFACGNMRFYK